MTLDELEQRLEEEHYGQVVFEEEFWGSCPCACGSIDVDGFPVSVWCRCWRVSENDQDLHIYTEHPKKNRIAYLLKKNLDAQEWYNPYTVIWDKTPQSWSE